MRFDGWGVKDMANDFSARDQRERVAQCLQYAEAARTRAEQCSDARTRELYLRLAECWLSLSRSFESAAALAAAPPQVKRGVAPRALDASLQIGLKSFAAQPR